MLEGSTPLACFVFFIISLKTSAVIDHSHRHLLSLSDASPTTIRGHVDLDGRGRLSFRASVQEILSTRPLSTQDGCPPSLVIQYRFVSRCTLVAAYSNPVPRSETDSSHSLSFASRESSPMRNRGYLYTAIWAAACIDCSRVLA